jgi:hypothetical protein
MAQLRYAPYLVVYVCSREVIYNRSYDTNIVHSGSEGEITGSSIAYKAAMRSSQEVMRVLARV